MNMLNDLQTHGIDGLRVFGSSVACSRDGMYMIVGVHRGDHRDKAVAGTAYVYIRTGSTWTQQAKLMASDSALASDFGWAVSITADGSRVIVGARRSDVSGIPNAGAAYVFVRSDNIWTQEAKLIANDRSVGDEFGSSVSISDDGNHATITTYNIPLSETQTTQTTYVFVRYETNWFQEAKFDT